MNAHELHVTIRAPRELIWEGAVPSLRVPTETGQVGLRFHCEPMVLAIEAGLVLAKDGELLTFIGTAGGLLTTDGQDVTIATPMAVVGKDRQEVMAALESALRVSDEETEARQLFSRLQESILHELSENPTDSAHAKEKLR